MPRTPASASSMASADITSTKHKASRAKHACRICNARRVKCNVTEVQPCSNCQAAQVTCEVLPSRRGRYPRRSKHYEASSSVAHSSPGHARLQRSPRPVTEADPEASRQAGSPSPAASRSRSRSVSPAEPGALFFGESNFLTLVPGTRARHTRQAASKGKDGNVADKDDGHERQRLMFPVPSPQSQSHSQNHSASPAQHGGCINVAGQGRRPDLSATTMRYLHDEGVLTVPDLQSCLPAIKAYFTWFHPCFPVLDRADVARRLADQTISRLLLNGMLFIGATYCDDATIAAMGFADRSEAKHRFYSNARILFHADWETDRMALIQSLFLMSFWRGGPEDVRDVRYWLGVVITVAGSHGLHRSQGRQKENKDARMRRRIWWSIYVRERQAAVSLGLPSRIRDEDCDVEPLSAEDLEGEELALADASVADVMGFSQPQHVAYIVKMVEIAHLLGRIMDVQFVPGRKETVTSSSIEELDESLEAWKNSLPSDMQYSDDGNSSLWTCLLHLAYNYCRILIHRNDFLKGREQDRSVQVVIGAASRISRIAEDMSAQGTLRYGQFHLITSLFGALCIHAICIRRSTDISQRISIHRAQLCLLCLKEVQKYWRINNNILNLFLHYLDGSIAKQLQSGVGGGDNDATNAPKAAADTDVSVHQQPSAVSLAEANAASALGQIAAGGDMMRSDGRSQPPDFFEEQYLGLVNGSWDGGADDALGDLGLFLQGDEFMQEGLGFLGRSL